MVKLQIDTNRDAIQDLREAIDIIEEAITRREAETTLNPEETVIEQKKPKEETALETPFFKITVESEGTAEEPTLNELLSGESITEDELTDMFEKHPEKKDEQEEHKKKETSESTFIEIVEFDD